MSGRVATRGTPSPAPLLYVSRAAPATEKREACGIIGIWTKNGEPAAPLLFAGNLAQQHRGQQGTGIVTTHDGKFDLVRGPVYVREILRGREPEDLVLNGTVGIGHDRYSTVGNEESGTTGGKHLSGVDSSGCRDTQPFIDSFAPRPNRGPVAEYHDVSGRVAIAHNGQISNFQEVEATLKGKKRTRSDSELILKIIVENLDKGIVAAVTEVMHRLSSAYSVVGIVDGALIAFRDPNEVMPLVYGENDKYISVASEKRALDTNNIPLVGDIRGGELMIVRDGKAEFIPIIPRNPKHCMFQKVYFEKPDAISEGRSTYDVRWRLGEMLAREHPIEADLVIPVLDSASIAAQAFASASKIPYAELLVKNDFVGRSFMAKKQSERRAMAHAKHNPIAHLVAGKRVVLVDDSIVRGTTNKEIVAQMFRAGAKEVHLLSTCPPIINPCYLGTDMKTHGELVARRVSYPEDETDVPKIAEDIGASSLGYMSIEGLVEAIGLPAAELCLGCLGKWYANQYAHYLEEIDRTKWIWGGAAIAIGADGRRSVLKPRSSTFRYRPGIDEWESPFGKRTAPKRAFVEVAREEEEDFSEIDEVEMAGDLISALRRTFVDEEA